jgi:hypothetical protein
VAISSALAKSSICSWASCADCAFKDAMVG